MDPARGRRDSRRHYDVSNPHAHESAISQSCGPSIQPHSRAGLILNFYGAADTARTETAALAHGTHASTGRPYSWVFPLEIQRKERSGRRPLQNSETRSWPPFSGAPVSIYRLMTSLRRGPPASDHPGQLQRWPCVALTPCVQSGILDFPNIANLALHKKQRNN
jgi:hypothetical protein